MGRRRGFRRAARGPVRGSHRQVQASRHRQSCELKVTVDTELRLDLVVQVVNGKVVNEQAAFFTGADDAWASGVGMLIRHGVLASEH